MRTDVQRIAAYNARMQSTEIDPVLTAVAPNAQVNFASYMADFYPKQLQLTQLMDTNGIPSYQRGWYQALLGQMYHTSKVASGGAAVAEFTSLVAKWEARGLGHGIMVQMAFVIFSVVIVQRNVPDYDVSAEGLASPPNPAFLETYTPAILVKNNGVHEVDVSGTIGIFNLDTGVQVFSAPVTLSGLDAGDTGEARASSSWTPEVIGHYYAYGFVTCDHDGNPSNGQLPPTPFTVSSEPPPPPPPVPAHAPQHEKDGTDKIDVDDLPGKLADPQTPEDHASTHQVGGEDALNVGGLSGQLAQDQPPQTHSNSKHFPVMATAAELEAHEGAGAAHSDALNLANREITGDDAGEVVADQLSPSSEATLTGQDQYRLALLQSTPATMKAVRQWGFPWPTDHAPMHDVGGRDQLTFSPVHTASAQTVIFTPAGGQAIVLSIPFSQAETVAGLIGKLRLSGQLATGVVPGQQLLVGIDYKSGATTKPICQAQIALSQGKVYDFNFDGYAILDPNVQWRGAIDCLLVDIASPSGEAHSIGLPAIFQTPLAAAGSLQIWVWLTVLDVATSGTVLAAAGDVAYPVQAMWTKILKTVLAWLVRNARWNTYLSPVPIGVRLGGRDDTQLPDQFRIIELELAGLVIFRGYWQNQ